MNWSNGNASGHYERCGGTVDCLRAVGHEGDHRPRLKAGLLGPVPCGSCQAPVYWGRRKAYRDYPPRWRDMNRAVHRCAV